MKDLVKDAVAGYEFVIQRPATHLEKNAVRQAVSNALMWYLYDLCEEFKQWTTAPGVNGEPVTRETKKAYTIPRCLQQMPKWKGGEVYERLSRF